MSAIQLHTRTGTRVAEPTQPARPGQHAAVPEATVITRPSRRTQSAVQRFLRTPKGCLLLAFIPLLALATPQQGWQRVAPHVAAAVLVACAVDVALARWRRGMWLFPSGALLTGLIVAFVLSPDQPLYVPAATSALAVASKFFIRVRRSHVFNPAALALLLSIVLFGSEQSWWGALPEVPALWIVVLLATGAVIAERTNKFPLVLVFAGTYFAVFTLVAFVTPSPVTEMFRDPFVHAALFLAFFMLTDPPTSPGRYGEQVWFGVLVAMVSCAAELLGAGQAYLLIGLLMGNVVLAVNRWT